MKKFWWIAACVAVLVMNSGCESSGREQNTTDMRVLNAVIDAEALDVLVDDDVKASGLAAGSTAAYVNFSSGGRNVKIRSATTQTVLLERSIDFSSTSQTLVVYGRRSAIGVLLLNDDTTPSSGKFRVRALGLSPEAASVDVYLTSGDISSTAATLSAAGYGAVTDYVEVNAGSTKVIFTTAGTKEVIFESAVRDIGAGTKLTVAAFPSAGGKLVNAVLLTGGSDASATFLANPLARVKAINSIADSTPLNFKADSTVLLSNVPFAAASSYVTTTSGTRTLQIEASNVPGSVIASTLKALESARDYSVLAVGTTSQPALTVLVDENFAPTTGTARVRFVNGFSDSLTVDVLVNFAAQTSGLHARTASGYYAIAGGTTYTITFATEGGVSVLATLVTEDIASGGVYSIYVLGTPASPQVRLVRDR